MFDHTVRLHFGKDVFDNNLESGTVTSFGKNIPCGGVKKSTTLYISIWDRENVSRAERSNFIALFSTDGISRLLFYCIYVFRGINA